MLGKSYLTALYCVVRCILYPGTKICIASGTKGQARNIVTEKIQSFYNDFPMIQREIEKISPSINDCGVDFYNGSWIKVVASRDSARSARANVLVLDEFRLIDLEVIKKVLTKFLTTRRSPGFLDKLPVEERAKYQEPNTEIYLSSAWYKDHWSWAKFLSFKEMMLKNDRYCTFGLPYQTGIKFGVLDKQRIIDEMSESDFDKASFDLEMGCIPAGEGENAYFKFNQLNNVRKINMPLIPVTDEEYLRFKGKLNESKFYKKKLPGEIRIVSMDVALMASKDGENDASSFTVIRCIPEGQRYKKLVEYVETKEGEHTDLLALRFKQLYYSLECDYAVLDAHGNGMAVYDALVKITEDQFRGVIYPAWTLCNPDDADERMLSRVQDENAMPVMYAIKVAGGNATQKNHEMAVYTKSQFTGKTISLLANETEAKEFFEKTAWFKKLSESEKLDIYLPFFQVSRLISEMVNLEKSNSGAGGAFVKLQEKKKHRKDRYSSLAYALYFIRGLEADLVEDEEDELAYLIKYAML